VISALVSSLLDKTLPADTVFLGEVGLGAEIRTVNKLKQRLAEVEKLGFKQALIPKSNSLNEKSALNLERVQDVVEAIKVAL